MDIDPALLSQLHNDPSNPTPQNRHEKWHQLGLWVEANPVPIPFKRLHPDALPPSHSSEGDAGADLFTYYDVTIPAGGKVLVKTGIKLAIPAGKAGFIWPRSGTSLKASIENGAGLIDNQYRHELGVVLYNHGDTDYTFKKGEAVAQMVVQDYYRQEYYELPDDQDLPASSRGAGWGSSGR